MRLCSLQAGLGWAGLARDGWGDTDIRLRSQSGEESREGDINIVSGQHPATLYLPARIRHLRVRRSTSLAESETCIRVKHLIRTEK